MIEGEQEAIRSVEARCDAVAIEKLHAFVDSLRAENKQQNLVAQSSLDAVWQRHIADSAQLLDYAPDAGTWLDLGSGPGLPGLVLAIMRPAADFHLVELRRRRVDFLHHAIAKLGLRNCTVRGERLELVERFKADAITARAFAPLARLIDLSIDFSTPETRWILPKGRSAAKEVAELPTSLAHLFHVEQSQTASDAGIVVGEGLGGFS